MKHHMIEHTTQTIACLPARVHDRFLNGFANSNPKAARRSWVFFEDLAPRTGFMTRTRDTIGTPNSHHDFAKRFLIKTDPDHEYFAFKAKKLAGKSNRTAPLTGPGFSRKFLDPELFVIPSLSYGSIGFMTSGRAETFIFVIDMGRRFKILLQIHCAFERGRTPPVKQFEHFFRDINPSLGTHLLFNQVHGKYFFEHIRRNGLSVRAERRLQRCRKVRGQVIPSFRNISIAQRHLDFFHYFFLSI